MLSNQRDDILSSEPELPKTAVSPSQRTDKTPDHSNFIDHSVALPSDFSTLRQPTQSHNIPSSKQLPTDKPRALPKDKTRSAGQSWVWVYEGLNSAIQVRHYSAKTFEAYRSWMRKFQTFTKSKQPRELCMDDVKIFLNHLAVDKLDFGGFTPQGYFLRGALWLILCPTLLVPYTRL